MGCLYGMLLGYSRPYQIKILCADKVLQKIVGFCGFPVQSTISRFLSSVRVEVLRNFGIFIIRGPVACLVCLILGIDLVKYPFVEEVIVA